MSPLRGPADRLSARWEHSFLWPVLACPPVSSSRSPPERLSIWFAPPRRSPGPGRRRPSGSLRRIRRFSRSPAPPLVVGFARAAPAGRRRSAVGVSLPLRSLSSRRCDLRARVEGPPAAAFSDLAFPLVRTGSRWGHRGRNFAAPLGRSPLCCGSKNADPLTR